MNFGSTRSSTKTQFLLVLLFCHFYLRRDMIRYIISMLRQIKIICANLASVYYSFN
jgi:hypothetical protein